MAEIRPFRGLRYDRSVVSDLSNVICPPYDIIPPALHQELHDRSEYNFIRIEDAKTLPEDTPADNKYTRAATTLQRWLKDGVLLPEDKPACYLHDHFFPSQGKTIRRRGLTVRVRLQEWEEMIIRPHEGILAAAKDDRLNLLWSLQVNTSPVLAMYEDKGERLASLLNSQSIKKPVIDVSLTDGERHRIILITARETVNRITRHFLDLPLYIADGHHRYTSALTYRREKMAYTPGATTDDPFNFVMMTLVSFTDPGLEILAPHRLIRGVPKSTIDGLEGRLKEFFEIQRLSLQKRDLWSDVDKLMTDGENVRFACVMTGADYLCVLTLKQESIDANTMPYFHTELYRKLDVSVIDHIILEKILGLGIGGTDEAKINYFYNRQDAMDRVVKGEYQLAFFLKPVRPELIKAVADAGDKMPRKSTYFYPKAPAGLVVNTLY